MYVTIKSEMQVVLDKFVELKIPFRFHKSNLINLFEFVDFEMDVFSILRNASNSIIFLVNLFYHLLFKIYYFIGLEINI